MDGAEGRGEHQQQNSENPEEVVLLCGYGCTRICVCACACGRARFVGLLPASPHFSPCSSAAAASAG
jgi:hypothetical protein